MNIDQQNKIIIQIENLRKVDIEKKLAEAYPNQTELGNIQISKMNVSEFLNLTKRLLNQILSELKSENRLILPFTFSTPEYGQQNLDQAIADLNSQISSQQFSSAENSLLWIAQYSLQNGFFDKSKFKVHSLESLKFEKQKESLDLITENYSQLKKKYQDLLVELENTKKTINDFYSIKQDELQQITSNLSLSNSNNTQIQNLLNTSTQAETKINSISEQTVKEKANVDLLKIEIDKTYVDFKANFNKLLADIKTSDTSFRTIYGDFDNKLKFVENKTSYFEERNKYLDVLIGREVGASLFETFKQRKKELDSPLLFWKWSIAIMTLFTFFIILAIFTNFFGYYGPVDNVLHWENIFVNALKASPFFFLLYYTIAQYNKERNFQEEYAFKSASALTIKAYADIINDTTKKDDLILKAVYGIYRSPIYNKIKTKEVNSAMDLLSEVVTKGSEILTKK